MNRAISDALKAHMAALTFSPAIPIGWPNRDFTPPADGSRYMVFAIVRAANQRMTLGGGNKWSGSIVVNIATPSGKGSGAGDSLADAVAAHFPADLALDASGARLRVTGTPFAREGYTDAGMWRTPLVIPFEVMTT